jgi:hypothetical protein
LLSRRAVAELRQLDREFNRYWPERNQATPEKCSTFLDWRIADYRRGMA